MNLYPIIWFSPAVAVLGPNLLPPGTLGVIPIDMKDGVMKQLTAAHVSLTQDFSLRSWISLYIDGISLMPNPGHFPLLRGNGLPIVLYHRFPPIFPCIPVRVTKPAIYYFNILNLTNEGNQFTFAMQIVESGSALAMMPIAEVAVTDNTVEPMWP